MFGAFVVFLRCPARFFKLSCQLLDMLLIHSIPSPFGANVLLKILPKMCLQLGMYAQLRVTEQLFPLCSLEVSEELHAHRAACGVRDEQVLLGHWSPVQRPAHGHERGHTERHLLGAV